MPRARRVKARSERSPPGGFLGLVLAILLPMGILGALGVAGLVRDRREVELQARNEALGLCDRLALRLRDEPGALLRDHARASDAAWTGLQYRAMNQPPPAGLAEIVQSWNRRHPSHPIEEGLQLPIVSHRDGSLLQPEPDPGVPAPPPWVTTLAPGIRKLLDEAGAADLTGQSPQTRRARWTAFRNQAGAEASPWADLGLARVQALESPASGAAQLESLFETGGRSESGLEVPLLAGIERLRLPDGAASPSGALRKVLLHAVTNAPSPVLGSLLDLARRRFPGDSGVAATLRMHALLQASRAFASRQQGSGVEGALPAPATEKAARLGADFLVRRETGEPGIQRLRLVPWSLVAATVEEGVRGLRPPPPDHAGVRVTVAGRSFGFESAATRLAMATAPMEPAGEVPPLEVGVFLASRDRLFATHTRRQALMAGWILLACAGGVGGLIVTWRALERQRRLAEERANFVASVSHELRAPVAAISLMVENMAGGVPLSADRRQEYHRLILRECRRLGALVENVLDISRIDRGAKRYHPEPTALVPLVTATVELMRHPAAQCGVTIETDLPPTADLQAVVDGRAIQQALVNLLDNAIKHSPAGGSPVRVLVGTRGNDAVIAVTDAGPGIPADQQQHIFERFRRLGSELRRETEGVGIGLALTRHILEAHRGTVEVESQPGKGSRFTLRFPITPEASKADGTDGPLHERKNEPG